MKKNENENENENENDIVSLKLSKIEFEINEVKSKLQMFRMNGDFTENEDLNILNNKLDNLREEKWYLLNEMNFLSKKKRIVTYKNLKNNEVKRIELTNTIYADPSVGKISLRSPLGKILSKSSIGKKATVHVVNNSYDIVVINIEEF